MAHRIAALSYIQIPIKAQEQIQALSESSIDFLDENTRLSEEDLITKTQDADMVLISPGTKLTGSYFDACPTVKYIGLCGSSTANINIDSLNSRNVSLSRVIDYGDEPTAEFIFMQLSILLRGIGEYQWKDAPRELMGRSIAIIGLGALGKSIANLAIAYKMKTSYYSIHRKPDWEDHGLQYRDLDDAISRSEIIVLSTPTNVRALEEKEFKLVKPNSILIQASSGDAFNKDAFLRWIAVEGNYAMFDYAAGEDVYQAYRGLPRVIFPKVTAGFTQETKQRLGERVVENLLAYIEKNN